MNNRKKQFLLLLITGTLTIKDLNEHVGFNTIPNGFFIRIGDDSTNQWLFAFGGSNITPIREYTQATSFRWTTWNAGDGFILIEDENKSLDDPDVKVKRDLDARALARSSGELVSISQADTRAQWTFKKGVGNSIIMEHTSSNNYLNEIDDSIIIEEEQAGFLNSLIENEQLLIRFYETPVAPVNVV